MMVKEEIYDEILLSLTVGRNDTYFEVCVQFLSAFGQVRAFLQFEEGFARQFRQLRVFRPEIRVYLIELRISFP